MNVSPSPENPGALNWFFVMLVGIIWGSAFMSVSVALDGFPPATVAAGRVSLGAIALLIVAVAMGKGLDKIGASAGLRGWAFVVTIGWLAVALPFSLLTWGQQYVPSAFAGVMMGAVPLIMLPLVYVFSPEEGIGPRRIIGMGIGFIGLIVLFGPGAFKVSSTPLAFWGQLACFGAACCYAVGSVITRRAPKIPPLSFAAGTLCAASVIMIPIALYKDGLPEVQSLSPTMALIYAALFPTALAIAIRIHVISTAGSLFMTMTSYMVPVWSVIFGMLIMKEELPAQLFTALALILVGIGVSQSRAIANAWRAAKP